MQIKLPISPNQGPLSTFIAIQVCTARPQVQSSRSLCCQGWRFYCNAIGHAATTTSWEQSEITPTQLKQRWFYTKTFMHMQLVEYHSSPEMTWTTTCRYQDILNSRWANLPMESALDLEFRFNFHGSAKEICRHQSDPKVNRLASMPIPSMLFPSWPIVVSQHGGSSKVYSSIQCTPLKTMPIYMLRAKFARYISGKKNTQPVKRTVSGFLSELQEATSWA